MFAFNLGFAGVGAATEYPQEIPSQFRPEMPDMPELPDASVENIRLANTIVTRKPPIKETATDDLSFGRSARDLATEKFMNDMRVSYAVSNSYKRRGEARARAQGRQNDRSLKNSESAGRINRRKLQGRTKRMEKSAVLRNARDVLGMGTDLYR